jgi:hypothetical protein
MQSTQSRYLVTIAPRSNETKLVMQPLKHLHLMDQKYKVTPVILSAIIPNVIFSQRNRQASRIREYIQTIFYQEYFHQKALLQQNTALKTKYVHRKFY